MDSQRQQKFSRQIQKDLGDIFQHDTKNLFGGAFITVTNVRVSPDLGVAKIYLSFLLAKDKQQLMDDIHEQNKTIRQMLAKRIKNQARVIPELRFYLDDTAEYASKMDAIIAGLNIPSVSKEDEDSTESADK